MESMKIGFTGTRRGMTPPQMAKMTQTAVMLLEHVTEFHHGDCVGADAEAHAVFKGLGVPVHVHPPSNPKMRAFCRGEYTNPPRPYLVRNKIIVEDTDVMFAAPGESEEQARGGTWSTIRYAKKWYIPKGKRALYVFFPDGTLVFWPEPNVERSWLT